MKQNQKQKDNSTFLAKARLRTAALRELQDVAPVILETHGGFGRLYLRCYRHVHSGVVFEHDSEKADALGRQRPTWAVYEADSVRAIRSGAGSHLAVNFVDFDPYGSPWETIDAFFAGHRPKVPRLVFAVNDGLRNNLKNQTGWKVKAMAEAIDQFGNQTVYRDYGAVCKWLLEKKAAAAGYRLTRWVWHDNRRPEIKSQGDLPGENVVHYAAVLDRG